MTFEAFTQKVEHAVRSWLGEEYRLSVQKILKNNGVELTGLIFMKEDSEIAATVYLDGFYEEYEKGRTMGETVERIVRLYESGKPEEKLDLNFFRDYEQVKKRLSGRLVSLERNRDLLEKVPHRVVLDLALMYNCILMGDGVGCASILINREHLTAWGIGEERLAADAERNMSRILPPSVCSMENFLHEMMWESMAEEMGEEMIYIQEKDGYGRTERNPEHRMPEKPENAESESEEEGTEPEGTETDGSALISPGLPGFMPEENRMLILSNVQHFYGAGALLYPGLLERLAQEHGCGFFILPSSVHEVILLTDYGEDDPECLGSMVREVNRENVPREEFLSDHVYYYDRESGLRILTGAGQKKTG